MGCSFSLRPRITIETLLKKTKVKLDLLTITYMLLMVGKGIREELVGKGIREELCHTLHGYAKNNKKYIKDYHKERE